MLPLTQLSHQAGSPFSVPIFLSNEESLIYIGKRVTQLRIKIVGDWVIARAMGTRFITNLPTIPIS